MIFQISLNKTLFHLKNQDLMKKASIDHLLYQPMLVFIQHILISIEVRYMIGVLVVTHKMDLGVMVNANGLWLDADLFNLMLLNLVTLSFATVSYLQTHPSAMEHINKCLDGYTNIIEDSGECGVLVHYGWHYFIGCTHSISEKENIHMSEIIAKCFKLSLYLNFIINKVINIII